MPPVFSPEENSLEKHVEVITEGCEEILVLDELEEKLKLAIRNNRPLVVKFGVDPTAPDLHLGHSVALWKLRDFQNLGHKVVLLIGDFTARIGDPSERSATRPQLSPQKINSHAKTYTDQAFKILDRERTEIKFNSSWFAEMSFEEVLELASKFTVARLLERDDFAKRYEANAPIGLHEFLYPVMQAYDSLMLESDVEVGGTDQKFNMLAGREIQRGTGAAPQIVVTVPILEGTDGVQKMSKSLKNQIGLADPPAEMFGKIMSIPDALMVKYFALLTKMNASEIAEVERGLEEERAHPAELKRRLGRETVSLYWSDDEAVKAEQEFDKVFRDKEAPTEIPSVGLDERHIGGGRIWVIKLLRETGLVRSNSEARRLIAQGGVRINGETVASEDLEISISSGDVVQIGKRRFAKIVVGDDSSRPA